MAETNEKLREAIKALAEEVWHRNDVPPPYPAFAIKVWFDEEKNEVMAKVIDEAEFYYGGPK